MVFAEQVSDLLLVDLEVGHSNEVLFVLRLVNVRENVLKRVGDYPSLLGVATDTCKMGK